MYLVVISWSQLEIRSCRFHTTRRNCPLHKNLDLDWKADLVTANIAVLHSSCFSEVLICLNVIKSDKSLGFKRLVVIFSAYKISRNNPLNVIITVLII